jgi:hypothetical protein
MIRLTNGHYVVFCRGCSAYQQEEAPGGERVASRRVVVQALAQRGWRPRESAHVPVAARGLGGGEWECPTCAQRRSEIAG